MKPSDYAISVQWGGGHHYFTTFTETEGEALSRAEALAKNLIAQRARKPGPRKGTVPVVYVWALASVHKGGYTPLPKKPRSFYPRSKKQ